MEINNNLSEINAEMLLNYLYPDLQDKWIVRHEGTFYRNYNDDTLSINENDAEVSLARDGFLKLLPQGFITQDDDLKKGNFDEKYQSLQKRKHIIEEAFLPIDTFAFRRRLQIERNVSQILDDKLNYILNEYFNFDITTEKDPFVKEFAVLLPFVSRYRADFSFVRNVIESITKYEVEMIFNQFSHYDTSKCSLPHVQYNLIINDLTSETVNQITQSLKPLNRFVNEWFMPYEVICDISVKYHDEPLVLDNNMILNYNTEL